MGVQLFYFIDVLTQREVVVQWNGVTANIPFIVLKSCLPIAEAADVGLSDGL